jgi:hypothetical protein
MSPTVAVAHEGWTEGSRTVAAKSNTAVSAAKVGGICKKKGLVKGKLTCKKIGGKLKWVKTSRTTTVSTTTASTADLLCRNSTYTSQVSGDRKSVV